MYGRRFSYENIKVDLMTDLVNTYCVKDCITKTMLFKGAIFWNERSTYDWTAQKVTEKTTITLL